MTTPATLAALQEGRIPSPCMDCDRDTPCAQCPLHAIWWDRHAPDQPHPCGNDCCDCADIWLFRLFGLGWKAIDERMRHGKTWAQHHAQRHHMSDPKPCPGDRPWLGSSAA